ncbi:Putative sgc region protein SgcQ [Planctomycetes bacterium Poly30]|uniref:Sgc region protein SgcQ n=1 Tax=Saltatorellus ferox TaxID=2528018 RepID=A0A518EUK2_9BACT|nr:Putative sgc region protein SgcQ [Planctomycetes bacterium Poly30]
MTQNRIDGLIGVIHLLATPGAVGFGGMAALLERAVADAAAFVEGGIRRLIVENYHDAPFFKEGVGAETVAALALAVDRVRSVEGVGEVGVNVLRNDAASALGIAAATGARFVRVNVHTGAMFTDQGLIEGHAAATMRLRERLGGNVALFADVHVKHATPIAGERLEDAARDAVHRGRADGLIVSGVATGAAPEPERVQRVRAAVGDGVPILIGSGFSLATARGLLEFADGAIVGTAAKRDGRVENEVDAARVRDLVDVLG